MHVRILLAAAMTLAVLPAFAASSNLVSVPLGALVTQILSLLEPLALSAAAGALAWLMARLGPEAAKSLHAAHVDRMIAQAVDAGFGLVEGAEAGKQLEIPVANKVIRKAAQYLIDQAPGLFKELGENLGPMLVARLSAQGSLPAAAGAANLDLDPYVEPKSTPVAS